MPAAKLANLSVGVSADTAELTQGFKKAESAAVRFGAQLTARGTSIGTRLATNVTGPLAAAFLGFNIAAFGKSVIDSVDAFNDLSDATGASIENLSALEEAARRTGGNFETVESTLLRFNKQLADAGDNASGDAFRALGLDLARLRAIDPAEALRQTAIALQGIEDVNVRARITMELFGKSAKDAAPFLKDLAEQGRLNATVTTAQAAAAEEFNKAIAVFTTETGNAARSIVSELLPALTSAISQLNDGKEAYGGFYAAAKDLPKVNPFKNTTENITATRDKMAALQEKIRAIQDEAAKQSDAEKRWSPTEGRIGQLNEELRLLKARETYLLKQQERSLPQAAYGHEGGLRTGTSANRLPGEDPLAKATADRKAADDAKAAKQKAIDDAAAAVKKAAEKSRADEAQRVEAVENYIDGLKRQQDQLEDVTVTEQLLRDVEAGRIKFATAAEAGRAAAAAQSLDALRERLKLEKEAEESAKRLAQLQADLRQEGTAIADAGVTPQERYEQQMKRLHELYENGHLGKGDKGQEVFDRASNRYAKELQEAKGGLDQLTEFSKQASANIQDALGDALENGFNGTLRDMAQSWLEMLRKMAAQALAARLNNAMFGSGKGDDNGWLGTLITAGAKAWFGAPAAAPDAYSNPDLYNVPKLAAGTNFVPYDGFVASLHRGEKVVPAKYAAKEGRGDMQVNIQNHGADVQTRKNDRGDLEVVIRNMVRNEMAGDLASGGPISRAHQRTFGLTRTLDRR